MEKAPPAPPRHTIIVSDLHLTQVEDPDPSRPLWMRYKHRDLIIDGCFERFLAHQREQLDGELELVLNGDIFDFDAVVGFPEPAPFPVSWLERRRGLAAEEAKSRYKMQQILDGHPVFMRAVRAWILDGNTAVLVVGNHDAELNWPSVREMVLEALDLPDDRRDALRVCEWFYVSGADTLVEHGSQYDAYCVCPDPLHPTFEIRGRARVRVPFGNLAGRILLNGMGLFNPYVESTFIKPLREYMLFFFKHVARTQPLIGWTWLWGAVATLVVSLREGFRPARRDPLQLAEREAVAAEASNATPDMVRALRELRVHPAIFNPWKILRELWLDRALILAAITAGCFWLVGFLNVFGDVSPLWALLLFLWLLPPFAFYARSVNSDVGNTNRSLAKRVPVALRIAGVRRAVIGHTHEEGHEVWGAESELINTGTWSTAFEDVEYTRPFGRKCFAWIHPSGDGERIAELLEWTDPGCKRLDATGKKSRGRLRALTQRLPVRRRKAKIPPTKDSNAQDG